MLSTESLLALIPLLPLTGALINGLFGHRLPRAQVALIACTTVFIAALVSTYLFVQLLNGPETAHIAIYYPWINIGGLNLNVALVVDHLSAVMVMLVTWVGLLIHIYSYGYMSHEPALARYYAYLNLFMFSMLTLVLGASLPMMFVGWEGVGLCSYLLIGFWYTDSAKAAAGKKAFIVNRVGDFGFIVAMLILFRVTGTLDFSELQHAVNTGTLVGFAATAACLMLFVGACGKSAQLPLYTWLPDAMAGPTPVSALIHAATMVTAGVYMVCRMGFLFQTSPTAMLVVASVGAATALFAASIATVQNDIKKVLAYSTMSQLGFMFIAAGVGAYAVAMLHVVTHAFFKACLFLGSGSVIHGMGGEQDMRQMGGLWKRQPITFATFFIATLAITGFPLTSGFISKDAILWFAFSSGHGPYATTFAGIAYILWGVAVFAAGLTAFYMWRCVLMTFFSGTLRANKSVADKVHESSFSMTFALVPLAILALVGGALGWPHLLGGHDAFAAWLAPSVGMLPALAHNAPIHGAAIEWGLMGASTAIAGVGFAAAYFCYGRGIHPITHQLASQKALGWLYIRLLEKWHVDELYDAILVKPIFWASKSLLYRLVDTYIIDGAVHFIAWCARSFGIVGQIFQSGNIQRYLAIFAIGVAVMLYGWFSPPPHRPPPFDVHIEAAP